MPLQYVSGDATAPQRPAPWMIAHVCNDLGRWGKGFVKPLARRWPAAKREYLARARATGVALGEVQFVALGEGRWVANMIGQRGVYRAGRKDAPIRYEALARCLARTSARALELGASLHMPRIGAGLAGGDWAEIEALLRGQLALARLEVLVYTLPPG